MAVRDVAFVRAGWMPTALAAVAVIDLAHRPPEEARAYRPLWTSTVAVIYLDWLAYLRWNSGLSNLGSGRCTVTVAPRR